MREVGINNWKISPLFEKTCGKDEIRKFEKKWVEILDADLNTNLPVNKSNEQKLKNVRTRRSRDRNLEEKKYFCEVCEKAFQSNWNLNQHKDSLTHQFTFLNSLD